MKRHPSLAVLSRDHHLGLVLVQRLQGKAATADSDWPQNRDAQRDRTLQFFDREMEPHFRAEEQFLFPLAGRFAPAAANFVALLLKQHGQIRALAGQLRGAKEVQLANLLLRFAHVLEEHIRKEERSFFEHFQKEVPEDRLIESGRQIEEYLRETREVPGSV